MGEAARGESVPETEETTEGVRREGVSPRGEGSAHVGGKEVWLDERAGEEVTDERVEELLKARSESSCPREGSNGGRVKSRPGIIWQAARRRREQGAERAASPRVGALVGVPGQRHVAPYIP